MLVAAAAVFVAIPAASVAASVRIGSAPTVDPTLVSLGALSTADELNAEIALTSSDPAALQQLVAAVSTPGSANYRQYLTPGQFAARFGAAPSEVDAIRETFAAMGLSVGTLDPDGLFLPISGSVATFERALSLSFRSYRSPRGNVLFANAEAPLVPEALAPTIRGILGLDNLTVPISSAEPAPASQVGAATAQPATSGPSACSRAITEAGNSGAYTANQISAAYSFNGTYNAGDLGTGVTVALYELEPYAASTSDTAAFESCYGLSTPVSYEKVDGGPISCSGCNGLETQLDIDNVIELAPSARVVVYQGPNSVNAQTADGPFDTYKQIVDDDTAQVVSTSWAECEYDLQRSGASIDAQAESTLFAQAAVQGQSIVAATGDDGSEGCDYSGTMDPHPTTDLAVLDPASQPNVTGVGGTTLNLANPQTETAWIDGGGGISSVWTMPSFQSSARAGLNVVNSNSSGSPCMATSGYCREVPDVAASANPTHGYVVEWSNGGLVNGSNAWTAVGGTSGAAPLWAAIFALADTATACQVPTLGLANPALYSIASTSYSTTFTDITSGNNDMTGAHSGADYPAGTGYDLATGLGTPIASGLVPLLAGPCVASVAPNAGLPGQTVTITGQNLSGVTGVAFGSAAATMSTVVVNATGTSMTVKVPTEVGAQTAAVTITTARGSSPSTAADAFTYGSPVVTGVTPSVGGTGSVTISGSGLTNATAVAFGSSPASFTALSDSALTSTPPAGLAGIVDVTVANASGTSATSTADQYAYPPIVTSLSAQNGTSGTTVQIFGAGFLSVPQSGAVAFGGTSASYTVQSDTTITATAPNTTTAGAVAVTVTGTGGTSLASAATQFTFEVTVAPTTTTTITAITPTTIVTIGRASAGASSVDTTPSTVEANGSARATVVVTVRDAEGHRISGQRVTLSATNGSSKVTTLAAVSNGSGEAKFAVSDGHPEAVSYRAVDSTAKVTIGRATVHFTPAASTMASSVTRSGGITSSCHTASASASILVTVRTARNNALGDQQISLSAPGFHGAVHPSPAATRSNGTVAIVVTDKTAQTVTFTAREVTDGLTLAKGVTISFPKVKRC